MNATMRNVQVVDARERAEVLMHPLRLRVLEAARTPGSAAELARRLDLTPQKVNYHVHRLAEHGFLEKVEERRAGNVVETVYGATAESYVLASGVLGGLAPGTVPAESLTAARWLGLQARAEAELGEVFRRASSTGQAVPTISMDAEIRFETAEQQARFARALRELVMAVVSKYTSPARTAEGRPGPGHPFRLLVGCYPIPEPPSAAGGDEAGEAGDDHSDPTEGGEAP